MIDQNTSNKTELSSTRAPLISQQLHALTVKATGVVIVVNTGSIALAATMMGYEGLSTYELKFLQASVCLAIIGIYSLVFFFFSFEVFAETEEDWNARPAKEKFLSSLVPGGVVLSATAFAGITLATALLEGLERKIDHTSADADGTVEFYFDVHQLNLDQ